MWPGIESTASGGTFADHRAYAACVNVAHLIYGGAYGIAAVMDALDKMIAEETQALGLLAERYAAQKIKVEALLAAAAARPVAQATQGPKTKASAGGKPKGAISVAWRTVLEKAYRMGRRFAYDDVQIIYTMEHEKALELSSVRDRVRNFIEWGFVEGTPETGFTVTDLAVSRFNFSKPSPASEENGSHSSDASEPSAQGWSVSPPQPSIWRNPQSGPAS